MPLNTNSNPDLFFHIPISSIMWNCVEIKSSRDYQSSIHNEYWKKFFLIIFQFHQHQLSESRRATTPKSKSVSLSISYLNIVNSYREWHVISHLICSLLKLFGLLATISDQYTYCWELKIQISHTQKYFRPYSVRRHYNNSINIVFNK